MSSRAESGLEMSGNNPPPSGNGKKDRPDGPYCPHPPRERPQAPRKEEHAKKHITQTGDQHRRSS
jgi:hypothetical protein